MRSNVPRIQLLLLAIVVVLVILTFALPLASPVRVGSEATARSGSGMVLEPAMARSNDNVGGRR